jgi:hypothetical protein
LRVFLNLGSASRKECNAQLSICSMDSSIIPQRCNATLQSLQMCSLYLSHSMHSSSGTPKAKMVTNRDRNCAPVHMPTTSSKHAFHSSSESYKPSAMHADLNVSWTTPLIVRRASKETAPLTFVNNVCKKYRSPAEGLTK